MLSCGTYEAEHAWILSGINTKLALTVSSLILFILRNPLTLMSQLGLRTSDEVVVHRWETCLMLAIEHDANKFNLRVHSTPHFRGSH